MLKRYLEEANQSSTNIDELAFRDLLRVGAEAGVVRSPEKWFVFREMRNITSHAYDEAKAIKICAVIPEFVDESGALLSSLKERSA
jgi:nucleotidyltransferase substrate binding protein (TIGR01987 family)